MKCHYVYDKEVGKVLIPGCWSVIHSDDMRDCTCRGDSESFAQFEKKEYNKKLNEQAAYIKELETEIYRLNRILKRINGYK